MGYLEKKMNPDDSMAKAKLKNAYMNIIILNNDNSTIFLSRKVHCKRITMLTWTNIMKQYLHCKKH